MGIEFWPGKWDYSTPVLWASWDIENEGIL
jgi:hypothetical protein